jgi:predicted dehydrogenase
MSHDHQCRTNRRTFIKSSTGIVAGSVLAAHGQPAAGAAAVLRAQRGDRLRLAIIGCGGRGAANLRAVSSEHVAVLCDVDTEHLAKAAAAHPGARTVADLRRVYDHAAEFDAVVVSTAEHTHAVATMPALQLKKHVFCEKPLTHNVEEARRVRKAAAEAGVATQMGTQIHASDNYRRVVELVQAGTIGRISECHVWVSRAWGLQSEDEAKTHGDIVFVTERPREAHPVPARLDWDLWLGPAPARPYNDVYLPGPKWYRWWDFGNGTMSDLGSHWIDLPFWALKLQTPAVIEPSGPPPHPELAPASMRVRYDYKAMGDQPEVSLTWYQGVEKPEIWTKGLIPPYQSGVLFVGDRGMIVSDYGKHAVVLDDTVQGFQRPAPSIPKSLGHHAEWIHACKTGAPTTCNFEYSGLLTEANHLGNVAYRVGRALEWDHAAMRAVNAPEADQFLRRAYRSGWSLT